MPTGFLHAHYLENYLYRGFRDNMLTLNKQIQDTKTPHDKEMIQRQIDSTDKQIDRLVYELYGLSDEEIKIVEESA